MKKENLEHIARKEKLPNRFPERLVRVIKGKEYDAFCRRYGKAMEKAFGYRGVIKVPTIIDPITRKPIPYWPKVGAAYQA